jgi:hypothetical protein
MDFAYPVTAADYLDYAHTWAQFAVYALCTVLAAMHTRSGAHQHTYRLVAGAFICYALADLFVNLYVAIHHIYPYFFSVAELAWFSIYIFLASVCLNQISTLSLPQRRALKKYRLRSHLIALLALVPLNIFIIYQDPGSVFNSLLYAAGDYLILVLTLNLLFASVKDQILPKTRSYHIVIVLYIASDLCMFLFSSLYTSPLYNLYYVFNLLQTVAPFVILHILKKEWAV